MFTTITQKQIEEFCENELCETYICENKINDIIVYTRLAEENFIEFSQVETCREHSKSVLSFLKSNTAVQLIHIYSVKNEKDNQEEEVE